jgi:glutaminyl-peptide cyclotransferase
MVVIFLAAFSGWLACRFLRPTTPFNGQLAYQDVLAQVSFGPRIPGSVAHDQTISYISDELIQAGWNVKIQTSEWQGFSVQNIIAFRSTTSPAIILGAHYDSRLLADQDPGFGRNDPVSGANDGASGVSILLELARSLPTDIPPLWLVFFDAEDNGGLDSRQWIMGSRAFAASMTISPSAVVIVDMVGDEDLNILIERNSNSKIASEIWAQAAALGYQNIFLDSPKYELIDDHIPFVEAGIPSVDVIDFDYPYWHTTADTADKVSAHSLQVVGETLWAWIASK